MKKTFRILKFKKDKPIFEVQNVSKSFDGRPILKKLSLKVYPGECVGVLGPNGCGLASKILKLEKYFLMESLLRKLPFILDQKKA